MKQKGNIKSNSWYNPNEIRNPLPTNYLESERDSELEQYIRCSSFFFLLVRLLFSYFLYSAKYEYKKFLDRSAVVASHLGPSRSSSTLSARAQSTPVTEHALAPAGLSSKALNVGVAPEHRPATAVPTISEAKQTRPTRSVSQPLASSRQQSQPQQQQTSLQKLGNPVWDDLISLQAPNATSSFPLQYQSTPLAATLASPNLNQTFPSNSNPFGNLLTNSSYQSPNLAGGYSPGGSTTGMSLQQSDPGVGVGRGSANPFQHMQQQQQQLGLTSGTPSIFMQGSVGSLSHPFAPVYPSSAVSDNFRGGFGGASPIQSSTPFQQPLTPSFQQSASMPSFPQQHSSPTTFQTQPWIQQQQQQNPFSQPSTAFQQQYFPSQAQVQAPLQHQQTPQFFQPQPHQGQQTVLSPPPFMGTPSPFDHQQQPVQQMYGAQGGGFGGWSQGQQWGGM